MDGPTKPRMWWPGIDRQHPLARGLVGAWLLNEGAGINVNDVVNGNNGTLTNMDPATDWVGSEKGWALDFDGSDDYVAMPQTLVHGESYTIVLRLKIDGGEGNIPCVWHCGTGTRCVGCVYVKSSDNELYFNAWRIDGTELTRFRNNSSDFVGRWIDLVLQRDYAADTAKVHLDGVEIADEASQGLATYTAAGMYLSRGYGGGYQLDGQYDRLLVYNRLLNFDEIQDLYVDPDAPFRPRRRVFAVAAAPPAGAIMNQFQGANLGADLYNGSLIA